MPGPIPATLGVILAGGLARRMGGGDKPLLRLHGRTLLEHAAQRLAPQCESLILNANGDASRFAGAGLPVVPDCLPDHPGPLAGILTALEWTAVHRPLVEWVVSVPGDTPFLPHDLVRRLHETREAAGRALACAASGPQAHYAVGIWPVRLRQELRQAIVAKGIRSIRDWAQPLGMAEAAWPGIPYDPFFNINTPEDLARAAALVEQHPARA
jgi:molybdopterin-guanine dinucleotide biosynthesis protein A